MGIIEREMPGASKGIAEEETYNSHVGAEGGWVEGGRGRCIYYIAPMGMWQKEKCV